MAASQEYIDGLVRDLRERLSIEVKGWIDPGSEAGQAKIVRGCIALRNQDGGFFVVGFEDGTWQPDLANAPADVRAEWDGDHIQGLVGRHASEPFEVHLLFAKRDGLEYPVLEVEAGVRSPVAAKKEISNPDPKKSDKPLVRLHTVYARTLRSNGLVSSSEIHHADWPDMARRCSDNRESEIGAFLRRQLRGAEIGPSPERLPRSTVPCPRPGLPQPCWRRSSDGTATSAFSRKNRGETSSTSHVMARGRPLSFLKASSTLPTST